MRFYSSEIIHQHLDFPSLIDALHQGFAGATLVPQRMHIEYAVPGVEDVSTLLLMPAVQLGAFAGVKIVNVAPNNPSQDLATIQGVYYLMDASTGEPKAVFDARSITNWRTAAASALASRFLSVEGAKSLLLLGTGALAPYLVRAHAAVRPIQVLKIYGRTRSKAEALANQFKEEFSSVKVVEEVGQGIGEVDIISAATSSETPLIQGALLSPGQHVDLVGAYKPSTRESDDEVMSRGRVYADNLASALHEAGDLVLPIQSGVIEKKDIRGDLFQLCRGQVQGRINSDEITVFKSVGHAMEDLVTAMLLYQKID